MARKSNFDDRELQRALDQLTREAPVAGLEGLKVAATAFVELAKKRTKLASRRKIERDYGDNPQAFAQAAKKLGANATQRAIQNYVAREEQKRIKAIGYQRNGWRIRRIRAKFIEIVNNARNSRFVKNTVRAGRYASRETLKKIPHLVGVKLRPVARRHSAR